MKKKRKLGSCHCFRICFFLTWSRRTLRSSISGRSTRDTMSSWCRTPSLKSTIINALSLYVDNKNRKMKGISGKVAVVTGASKGIGAAIAKEFANEGATVVINYASAKEDADRIVDEITKRGGQAVAVQANVAKKADVERLFSATKKAFGKIDILVNNAGVYDWSPIEEITEEQFHRQFDVNVLGLLLATQ